MQDLMKEIRNRLGYSQEQFASILGVSPISISRWENEKAIPSELAQKQIFKICEDHRLDLTDYIVDKTKSNNVNLVLYHASKNGITLPIQPISRDKCDFGKGFYMGTDPLQPLTLVCNEEHPVFYTLDFDKSDLKILDIEIGLDWAMLIAYYRGYMEDVKDSSLYQKYSHMLDGVDAVIGYIADDRMYQVLNDFFEQRITDAALMSCLSALKLGKQYVALSQKACDKVDILNEKSLSQLELLFLKNKSVIRRKEGISITNEVIKQHRRDGRYFDEILKEESL